MSERTDDVAIRQARPEEADVLTDIAYKSKAYWGYDINSLDQWAGPLTVSAEYIEKNPTFAACGEDGEILGFCSILYDEGQFELDHMWVAPSAIGMGIGGKLFLYACEEAEILGASSLWILSDPMAEGFYKHMGAVRIGQKSTIVDGAEHQLPILSISL